MAPVQLVATDPPAKWVSARYGATAGPPALMAAGRGGGWGGGLPYGTTPRSTGGQGWRTPAVSMAPVQLVATDPPAKWVSARYGATAGPPALMAAGSVSGWGVGLRYASTPNSMGGLPSSKAPMSGLSPV